MDTAIRSHPSAEELSDFATGRLKPVRATAVEAHVEACNECVALLEAIPLAADPFVAALVEEDDSPHVHGHPAFVAPATLGREAFVTKTPQAATVRPQITAQPWGEATVLTADPSDADAPIVPGYEILEELGRGGMGVVYKARQLRLDRLVALKMILAGHHAGEQHHLRFFAEAQAIARLQHPHIVQIHEFGQHAGRPYFSMEYAEGGNLADHLAGHPQPPRESAELVATLARAIQAAHDEEIVHRDLKPANVLLTKDGEIKVTDFGLAKQGESGVTASGDLLGTPNYMAPEQAGGDVARVGPHSDVYALGAVLYDCLTGRPPFKAATPMETVRQVLDQPPVPPRRLVSTIPVDLEVICLKCLRKEPEKRYASAEALAEDLDRFLAGRPIVAKPVGQWERFRLWVRRSPLVAGLAAAIVLVTITGIAGIWSQYQRAVRERDFALEQERLQRQAAADASRQKDLAKAAEGRATQSAALAVARAEQAERTALFLEKLFQSSDPTSLLDYGFRPPTRNKDITALDLLKAGTLQIKGELADQPEVRARLMSVLGRVHRSLGDYKNAQPLLEESLALYESLPETSPDELAGTLFDLAWFWHERGDYGRSEELAVRAIALQRRPGAEPRLARTLLLLGWTLLEQHSPDALAPLREAVTLREEIRRRASPDASTEELQRMSRDIAIAKMALIGHLNFEGKFLQAALLLPDVRNGFANLDEGPQTEKAAMAFMLGVAAYRAGMYAFADAQLQECLTTSRQFLGPDHYLLCLVHAQMALVRQTAGDFERSRDSFEACYRQCSASVGLGHSGVMEILLPYGRMLEDNGKLAEILPKYEQVIQATEERFGRNHVQRIAPSVGYATALAKVGRIDDACRAAALALELVPADSLLRNPRIGQMLTDLGGELWWGERLELAEDVLRTAARQNRRYASQSLALWRSLTDLAAVLREQGKATEAQGVIFEAQAVARTAGISPGMNAYMLDEAARIATDLDQIQLAEEYYRAAISDWLKKPLEFTASQDDAINALTRILAKRRDYPAAAEVLQQGCELLRRRGPDCDHLLSRRLRQLAACSAAGPTAESDRTGLCGECEKTLQRSREAKSRQDLLFAAALLADRASADRMLARTTEADGLARAALMLRSSTQPAAQDFASAKAVVELLYLSLAEAAAGKREESQQTLSRVEAWLDSKTVSGQRSRGEELRWDVRLEVNVLLGQCHSVLQ